MKRHCLWNPKFEKTTMTIYNPINMTNYGNPDNCHCSQQSTQVIAVEDKGKWGVPRIDYNRGPKASFTTTLKYSILF